MTGQPYIDPIPEYGTTGRIRSNRGNKSVGLFGLTRKNNDGSRKSHYGVDLIAPVGTPLLAAGAGEVYVATETRTGGKMVQIRLPDGSALVYAHLSEINVKIGDSVAEGQVIGKSGESGNAKGLPVGEQHVHFGVKDPTGAWIDPVTWVNSTPDSTAEGENKSSFYTPPMEAIRWSSDFTNPFGNVPGVARRR